MEEWTKAEIGVGAAIASGSHGEKGKIALLVIKVSNKKISNEKEGRDEEKLKKSS